MALHQILNEVLLMSESFFIFLIPALVRPTGRGNGERMLLSGITPTVHNPVTQSKHAIKVSIIN
jgi:hypothetical protein